MSLIWKFWSSETTSLPFPQIERLCPDWICISPGPKDPAHAGISKAVIQHFASTVPILGVCLGMQAINEVFEGLTLRAPEPVHGKRSRIDHNGCGVFFGLPSPFWAARYHSLQIDIRSSHLLPLAQAPDGVVMAIQHKQWPLCGVQFHPESFLSEYGYELTANFLAFHSEWSGAPSPLPRSYSGALRQQTTTGTAYEGARADGRPGDGR